MRGLNSLASSAAEVSMASLIYGYLAAMAAILVVLMTLLNSYLKPPTPTAVPPPPPAIGRNGATDQQTGQLPAAPGPTDASPPGAVSRALSTGVEVSKPESAPAPVEDSSNAQMPVNAEAAPAVPDDEKAPVGEPAKAEDVKPRRSASHHRASRHHERRHHAEAPYDSGWR